MNSKPLSRSSFALAGPILYVVDISLLVEAINPVAAIHKSLSHFVSNHHQNKHCSYGYSAPIWPKYKHTVEAHAEYLKILMSHFTKAEIIENGFAIKLHSGNDTGVRFHAQWLRDNSPDPDTRSKDNGQKLITIAEIPKDLKITNVEINSTGEVRILFSTENRQIVFSNEWLRQHAYDREYDKVPGWLNPELETWDNALSDKTPGSEFAAITTNTRALYEWLGAIRRYGFATLSGGPTDSGALIKIVDLFGYIRETNYGKWFNVQSEVKPSNLANTSLGLQAHTDNPYRNPTPTLQLLYCLENSAEGGESIVVDGFAACHRIREESVQAFDLLSRYSARFEYSGTKNICLRARRPVIGLSPDGELESVHFNNRSAAAITDVPYSDMAKYYEALRLFSDIVDDPGMAVQFRLEPGQSFIVDNTRVLHSRLPFSGTGKRWLQGCYPDKDGLLSTLTVLQNNLGNASMNTTDDSVR